MDDKLRSTMLRAKAEAQLPHAPAMKSATRPAEELLDELHVYQIELEMQNEELRRAYNALDDSRARYVNLYEFAPVGYLTLTHEGLIAEINLTGARLLGLDREKLVNRRFASLVAAKDGDRWHLLLKGMIRSSEELHSFELAIQRADNSLVYVQLNCLLMTTDDKVPIVRITLTDITERKQTQQLIHEKEIAERTLAEQRQFIAMVSHEFRSPLAVIDTAAQLLSIKISPVSDCTPIVSRIRRGVMRLSSFLDNCLTEDRLNSNGLALEPATIDLQELTAAVKDSAKLISGAHQILTELEHGLPTLEADPQLLRILLLNLLGNAIKYSPTGSQVRLCISCNGLSCIFKVIDQGVGIPAEEQSLVFQKYMRGRSVAAIPGAGLGLALVKSIVELHNGSIEINSRGNVGTCVTVVLPLKLAINLTTKRPL
ncbi:MAG: PAS domain-containing sensor histidine kinase [Methylobacter sp.]|uniref:histidine kinase n=1 Tax=Candidatus Methylobacter titanis TaxID=3053457 RepID=A0AA43Q8J5_9GAMM|nr:PAS domain-containing sensor histidine kinase [Candidatus Methylobacter titanis]